MSNKENCFGGIVVSFSPEGGSFGKPDCPYLKGFPCRAFIAKDKGSVCCYYSNSGEESYDDNCEVDVFRCCWLPSWVKNGFHEAKFYNGVLHGEGV